MPNPSKISPQSSGKGSSVPQTESGPPEALAVDPYALLGIGSLLFQIESDREIALLAASAIAAALQVEFGAVLLRHRDQNDLELFGHFNHAPLEGALAEDVVRLASENRFRHGQGSQVVDVDQEFLGGAFAVGLRQFLVAPVKTLHEDFGLVIAGSTNGRACLQHHHTYLETLAGQIAISLHRYRLDQERAAKEEALRQARDELELQVEKRTAELLQANQRLQQEILKRQETEEALRQSAKRLETLREIDRAILAESTVETIAEAALDHMGQLIPSERAIVAMFDLQTNTGTLIAVREAWVSGFKGRRFPLEAFGLTDNLRSGRVRLVENILNESWQAPLIARLKEQGLRSYIHVPLICQDELIGILGLGSIHPGAFTSEHVSIMRDIAYGLGVGIRQAQLAKQVETHAAQLEQRVAERTQELESFSYSVSHDLRAPLRAMEGFSRVFMEEYGDQLDDEGKRLLNIIRSNAQNMAALIDDLLAFFRLGRQEMNLASINMEDLVKNVLNTELGTSGSGRNVALRVQSLPAAYGDTSMLRQVFVDLLSNAFKFTRARETAAIEVGCFAQEDENVYYVKDNGVGFDMQYVHKLFGVFHRLHTSDAFEGTGVGLALVKRIVERHGGRAWAEGKEEEGATIYFTIPRKDAGTNER